MLIDFQVLAEKIDAEIRVYERRKSALTAKIRLSGGQLVPCRLVNVSPGGALIDVADVDDLPDEFNLIITTAEFEAACVVRHLRRMDCEETPLVRAGVMFMSNRLGALQRFG